MKLSLLALITFAFVVSATAQTTPTPTPAPSPTPSPTPKSTSNPAAKPTGPAMQQRPQVSFDLADYGVTFEVDTRLIVMMAALEAAGFEPQPGREPSEFRALLRRDQTGLDLDLKGRMKSFYERNKLPAPATPADQAARYFSLALALSPVPDLAPPERSDDLPGGILEVLDFGPLVREFYKRSGIDENLVTYVRAYQAEGDRLRQPTAEMVRSVLTFLHTRPVTTTLERVEIKAPSTKKKNAPKTYSTRQKDRRFIILPDKLSPRGAINFRVIGDDYYVIVPEGTDPTSSELRRAYLKYVIDALVLRFNKEIAARRDAIKQLIDERQKAGGQSSPDVFLTVTRSLVGAADARYDEARRLELLGLSARSQMAAAKDEATRSAILKSTQADVQAIQDETVARLADEYEKGAILSFFFSDQLKGIESAGFDIASFFPDMIASFDPVRELKRPAEYAEAKQRAIVARETRAAARRAEEASSANEPNSPRDAALVRDLSIVEDTLRSKNYVDAESRLKKMLQSYPGEARIFFALGQTASLAAMDATDDQIQQERLNRALGQYRLAVEAASPESDRAILSRAHESMGRINAFLENKDEALRSFEAAIRIGEVPGGAYQQALEGKRKLAQP